MSRTYRGKRKSSLGLLLTLSDFCASRTASQQPNITPRERSWPFPRGFKRLGSRGERHWRVRRPSGSTPRSQQQPEREKVRPEKRWYIENGDSVTGPELPGN